MSTEPNEFFIQGKLHILFVLKPGMVSGYFCLQTKSFNTSGEANS